MKINSIVSVHALVFGLGLACANGYGMNPMDNHYASPENNSANMPMESVNVQLGSVGSNSNIDYDSLSKDDLLRMFLRLEEQNREQTQSLQEKLTVLIAQNEEYGRRIESLESKVLDEQKKRDTKMETFVRQEIRYREAERKREKDAERRRIENMISGLQNEKQRERGYLHITGPRSFLEGSPEHMEFIRQKKRQQQATARISQIDSQITVLAAQLSGLR